MPSTLKELDRLSKQLLYQFRLEISDENITTINYYLIKAQMAFDTKETNMSEREFMIVCGRNACRTLSTKSTRQRKRNKKRLQKLQGVGAKNTTEPSEFAEAKEVYKEMKSLKPKSFNVMHMRIFDNMSFQEIANAYECSPSSIREVYYNGVDRLQRKFGKEC